METRHYIRKGILAELLDRSSVVISDKKLLFARPQVLSAARVRENWFLGSPSMARYYQRAVRPGNTAFLAISGLVGGRLLRVRALAGPKWHRNGVQAAIAGRAPPATRGLGFMLAQSVRTFS